MLYVCSFWLFVLLFFAKIYIEKKSRLYAIPFETIWNWLPYNVTRYILRAYLVRTLRTKVYHVFLFSFFFLILLFFSFCSPYAIQKRNNNKYKNDEKLYKWNICNCFSFSVAFDLISIWCMSVSKDVSVFLTISILYLYNIIFLRKSSAISSVPNWWHGSFHFIKYNCWYFCITSMYLSKMWVCLYLCSVLSKL